MNNIAKLISILFYSSEAVASEAIIKNLAINDSQLQALVKESNNKLNDIGLVIIQNEKLLQIVARPEYTNLIEEFYDSSPQPLSQPALETLSVIAYKQPITKEEIDEIRGVSSDQSLKNLTNKGLIKKITDKKLIKYKTTTEFLKLMGIDKLNDLDNYQNENK